MKIEWLQLFQFVDVTNGTLLDFQLKLPEIVIFCQILRIDSHLDNFTVLLQLTEDVDIDIASIIYIPEVLILSVNLPISEKDPVLKNVLRWDLVVSFHNGPPIGFRQRVVSEIDDAGRKLVCSSIFFLRFLLLSHGQVLQASISRCLQSVDLLLLTHDILMTIACTLLTEDHLQWRFALVFFFLDSP